MPGPLHHACALQCAASQSAASSPGASRHHPHTPAACPLPARGCATTPQTDTSKALSEVLAAGGRPVGSFIPISLADTKAKTAVLVNAAQALGEAEAIGATTTTATQTSTQVTP